MEEDHQPDTIFEVKEEFMVSVNGGCPTRRKAHFLKPTASSTTSNGEVPELPPDCLSPNTYDLRDLSEKVEFNGWKNPTKEWKTWVHNMHSKHQALWKRVGIHEAVISSRYAMKKHQELVLGIAEKWCLDTNTFVFPWGEATLTLEDLMVCWGYPVLGKSVLSPMKTKQLVEVEEKLIERRKAAAEGNARYATHRAWMDYFMGTGHDLEHEAFLSLWLSKFVLVNSISYCFIGKHVFPVAVRLARGTQVALAPAVLSSIYKDLSLFKDWFFGSDEVKTNEFLKLYAPFQLVQVWAWERFPMLRPRPNSIAYGEPRVARWHKFKASVGGDEKLAIDSAGKSFQWRPYAMAVKNWSLPKFYGDNEQYKPIDSHLNEEFQSFARCLRASELVGVDSIEQYFPHRVAMQFGMDQDLPGCVARCNGNPEMAWKNYIRPIRDAVFYVPPRVFESNVTKQYSDWWQQSIQGHCDAISRPSVKRPRSPGKLHVPMREKECHTPDYYLLKYGESSRGNSSKENEDKEVQDEDMEDQLTLKEWLSAKHNYEETETPAKIKTLAEIEANVKPSEVNLECSVQDQTNVILENISEGDKIGLNLAVDVLPLSVMEDNYEETETPAEIEANVEPSEVKIESFVQDQTDAIMENVSEDDKICFTLAVDEPLSVGDSQNMPIIIVDEEDVQPIESESKHDAALTRNEISIGESKVVVVDGLKSKPGLSDGGEISNTVDVSTLAVDLEVRISRLEKVFSEVKEKGFGKKLKNHFAGGSSGQ